MTSFIVGGLLTLAPSILQTVVQITKGVNPSSTSFGSTEKRVIEAQYVHLEKKLAALNTFLRERAEIPKMEFTGTDESGYMLNDTFFPKIHACSELLANAYEDFLEQKVLPLMFISFFSSDYDDETSLYSSISKIPDFSYLELSMLNASSIEQALGKYSLYLPNYHFGVNVALSTVLTKLIDDSILAFSRVAPNRVICPTKYFCIIPYSSDDWFLGFHYAKSVDTVVSGSTCKIEIIFNDVLCNIMKTYKDLYNFEIQIWWNLHSEDAGWSSRADHERYGGKSYQINGSKINLDMDLDCTSGNVRESYSFKYFARLKTTNILAADVAKLHGMNEHELTYGNIMARGNYKLNDPIFSVRAIYNNTISSAQFSVQTAFALLSAWVLTIQLSSIDKSTKIKTRYSSIFQSFELEDLCSIDHRILRTEKLKGHAIQGLAVLWDRVINDLNFMKKYILRTKSGRILVSSVVTAC